MAVPWFSMCEWRNVYQMLFSDSPEEQRKGLDRLMGWKARCPKLPAAIESTLVVFQVLQEDPVHDHDSISDARKHQLRLMYSTAVMRFLNLMLVETYVDKENDDVMNMYFKAEKLNIPAWIVSLRHDAAHGTSLPDIAILRSAATFIKSWIQEHYWEHERNMYLDWHISKDDVVSMSAAEGELGVILEAWEALNMYKVAGFDSAEQIPDMKLRETVYYIRDMLQYDAREQEWVKNEKRNPTVSTSLMIVLRKLILTMAEWTARKTNSQAVVADLVVAGNFLLPSASVLKVLYPNGVEDEGVLHQLHPKLVECCEDLLYTLWNTGAIPELVSRLISISSNSNENILRRNMAALWAQKLFLSCLKVQEASKVKLAIAANVDDTALADVYKLKLSSMKKLLAIAAVEDQRPDLKIGYTWDLIPIPEILKTADFVKQSIYPPSRFTSIYLPCLLELTDLPGKAKKHLLDLVSIFSGHGVDSEECAESRIYSVRDIQDNSYSHSEESNGNGTQNDSVQSQNASHKELGSESAWTTARDNIDWGKVPLGLLPWQRVPAHREEEDKVSKESSLWPQLFLGADWAQAVQEKNIDEKVVGTKIESPLIRKVKAGRVGKLYVKEITPIKAIKKFSQGRSPSQKAIEFLSGLKY